jgi:hypothetical protein
VFVENFQSLSQLLSYTAQRGPQEDVLGETKWSKDFLTSPVESVMKQPVPCIPEAATINDAILAFVDSHTFCRLWMPKAK